jgi:hypothetical protein
MEHPEVDEISCTIIGLFPMNQAALSICFFQQAISRTGN